MNFSQYIKTFPRVNRVELRKRIAKELGVSEVYIRSMCNGNKRIPGKYAISIERITKGIVSRYETAPDLYPKE